MLQEELDAFRAEWAAKAAPERQALYEAKIAELRCSGIAERALEVGAQAPDFALPNAHGASVRLRDILGSGRAAVLAFYRGGWCPYCNIELRAYQRALDDIRREGGELIAISPETPDRSLSTAEKNALRFEVLSDVGQHVAEAFGIVYTLPPELRDAYEANGIDLAATNGEAAWRLPVPATFVVAPNGRIVLSFVDIDYRNRLEPDQIIGALVALRRGHRIEAADMKASVYGKAV